MAIVSIVDFYTASQYKNKSLSTKYEGKKHNVYLKMLCDDKTILDGINLAKSSPNILLIEYQGLTTCESYLSLQHELGIKVVNEVEVGNNFTEQDLIGILEDTPNGVIPVIKLQDDFKDLQWISNLCKKYPRLRFTGGNLFRVEGVRLGCYDVDDLEKRNIKYQVKSYLTSESADILTTVDILELDVTVSDKKEKESSKPKNPSSKPAKKVVSSRFSNIFSGGSVPF